jgi:hypothetical protein
MKCFLIPLHLSPLELLISPIFNKISSKSTTNILYVTFHQMFIFVIVVSSVCYFVLRIVYWIFSSSYSCNFCLKQCLHPFHMNLYPIHIMLQCLHRLFKNYLCVLLNYVSFMRWITIYKSYFSCKVCCSCSTIIRSITLLSLINV